MDSYQIIKRPLITEKSNTERESHNRISFEVDLRANKSEIKKTIERLFNVKVTKINTVTMPGKSRRFGRSVSAPKKWKKAIATLKEGDRIDIFEGA